MRKSVFLFLGVILSALFFTTGCVEKNPQSSDSINADSLAEDSLSEDSLSGLMEEEPMPVAADELFDDFFFNYAANRKVQRERTEFPLVVDNNGKQSQMEKEAWHRERFFMEQGYYTLIFHNASQLNIVKDTTVSDVTVEKINIRKSVVTRWHFARKRGLWYMNKLSFSSLSKHPDAQFIRFYQKFATDTAFQQKSLAESVSITGPDPDDDFSMMTGDIMPEQWPVFAPWMPSGTIYNIIYGAKPYPASNIRYFLIRGIANGLQTDLVFRRNGKNWLLTKVNN